MSASSSGSADCMSRIGDEVADRPQAEILAFHSISMKMRIQCALEVCDESDCI